MTFFEPGTLYVGPSEPPRCPVHKGPMRIDFTMDRYRCAGWDGEGCEEHVTMEEIFSEVDTVEIPLGDLL